MLARAVGRITVAIFTAGVIKGKRPPLAAPSLISLVLPLHLRKDTLLRVGRRRLRVLTREP
jgi:hypothetical protein